MAKSNAFKKFFSHILLQKKLKVYIIEIKHLAGHFNMEWHAVKRKQTCSCFQAQLKFINFFN